MKAITKKDLQERLNKLEVNLKETQDFADGLLSENQELKSEYEQQIRAAAINYGVRSIIQLSKNGDTSKNKFVEEKYQVETAYKAMTKYYYMNHKDHTYRDYNTRVNLSQEERDYIQEVKERHFQDTHSKTYTIDCDLIGQFDGSLVDIEVDGSNFHNACVDSAKDYCLNKRGVNVMRVEVYGVDLETLLARKLPRMINGIEEIKKSSRKFGTVRI